MKIKQVAPLFLALLGISLDRLAYWCAYSVDACYGSFIHQSLDFLTLVYLFSVITLPLAVVLCFVSSPIFKSWLKFTMWGIPLSVLVITLAPESSASLFSLYSFEKVDAAWMMSGLFLMISSAIIVARLIPIFLDKYTTNFHSTLKALLSFSYFWFPFSLAFIVIPIVLKKFLSGYFFNVLGFFISFEYRVWFMGGLFAVISLGIIVWKALSLRKKN